MYVLQGQWKEIYSSYVNDLDDASFVLGIEIHKDCSCNIIGLSQRYVDRILQRFSRQHYKPGIAPLIKSDQLNLSHCPHSNIEKAQMKDILYIGALESILHA